MFNIARCPECAGKMKFNPANRLMVCNSCGLSLSKNELDQYWKKIKDQTFRDDDDYQQKKAKKKEWLDWYSKSKQDKDRY